MSVELLVLYTRLASYTHIYPSIEYYKLWIKFTVDTYMHSISNFLWSSDAYNFVVHIWQLIILVSKPFFFN